MISSHLLKKAVVGKLTVMILVVGLSFAGPLRAGPPGFRQRAPYPQVGRFFPTLPGPGIMVLVGPKRYYYNAGVFYNHGPQGYRVVHAPLGAEVTHLPPGLKLLEIAGVSYFFFAGVYYKKTRSGYVVVEAPPAEGSFPKSFSTGEGDCQSTGRCVPVPGLIIRSLIQ